MNRQIRTGTFFFLTEIQTTPHLNTNKIITVNYRREISLNDSDSVDGSLPDNSN